MVNIHSEVPQAFIIGPILSQRFMQNMFLLFLIQFARLVMHMITRLLQRDITCQKFY